MPAFRRLSARTAIAYAVFGLLWVGLSDYALAAVIPAGSGYPWLQTAKGFFFVALSSLLVYFVAASLHARHEATEQRIHAQARLISDVTDALVATDKDLKIVTWNTGAQLMYGWSEDEVLGKPIDDFIKTTLPEGASRRDILQALDGVGRWSGEVSHERKDGTRFPVMAFTSVSRDEAGRPVGYVSVNRDISLLRQHEEELVRRNRSLMTIRACNRALVRAVDEQDLLDEICRIVVIHGGCRAAWIAYPLREDWKLIRPAAAFGPEEGFLDFGLKNSGGQLAEDSPLFQAVRTRTAVQAGCPAPDGHGERTTIAMPLNSWGEVLGVLVLYPLESGAMDPQRLDLMEELADDLAFGISTIRARRIRQKAESDLAQQQELLRETEALTNIGGWEYQVSTNRLNLTEGTLRLFKADRSQLGPDDLEKAFDYYVPLDRERLKEHFYRALETGEPYDLDLQFIDGEGERRLIRTKARAEKDGDKVVRLYGNIMDVTERRSSEAKIRQQFERISASREIDQVITATFDEKLSLNILLLHAVSLLEVDAARVLLVKPEDLTLRCTTAVGFRSEEGTSAPYRLGEAYTSRLDDGDKAVSVLSATEDPALSPLMDQEGFTALHASPLMVKGRRIGLLEVFSRSAHARDASWLDFLSSLANQAAIAIDNATLFRDLQKSNQSMALAYDATIEALSRALDIRDKETEGHSRRVTEKTLSLAKRLGLSEDQLVHIRRGALLHDIGKMGIPDAILHKPGPLTDEEWIQMKRHPGLAYEMLSPIHHLHAALEIPLCHHEKWDGTGYPAGLKGEAIPLAARLFAVVDVWDALLSDRPYRPGWPREKVLDHIRSASGTHFDPQVVELFLAEEADEPGCDRG